MRFAVNCIVFIWAFYTTHIVYNSLLAVRASIGSLLKVRTLSKLQYNYAMDRKSSKTTEQQ